MRFPAMVLSVLLIVAPALASERGTPEEAKAMLGKAMKHYKAVGEKQALVDFNTKAWVSRDLYVFCVDEAGKTLANGGFPDRVGMPAPALKTADGTELAKAVWNATAKTGFGKVEYSWTNPTTNETEPKVSFVQKAGAMVCGVGAYAKP